MYAVIRYGKSVSQGVGRVDIIAMFARQGGAIKCAQRQSDDEPGVRYSVAVLPEGNAPIYPNLRERIAVFIKTMPDDKPANSYSYSPAQSEPDDNADLPF